MNKLFLINHYERDFRWVTEYTENYLVYNKNKHSPFRVHPSVMEVANFGVNIYDMFHFFYYNYYELPDLIVLLQDYPFDHCRKELFDKLIKRNIFTPIEEYYLTPANSYEKRDFDGGFKEINNGWFIDSHNKTHGLTCKYQSVDQFMDKYFSNYKHVDYLRFAPGAQYIVEKQQILHYPRMFWFLLMMEFDVPNMTEAHIVERCLWMIFQCTLNVKKEILNRTLHNFGNGEK